MVGSNRTPALGRSKRPRNPTYTSTPQSGAKIMTGQLGQAVTLRPGQPVAQLLRLQPVLGECGDRLGRVRRGPCRPPAPRSLICGRARSLSRGWRPETPRPLLCFTRCRQWVGGAHVPITAQSHDGHCSGARDRAAPGIAGRGSRGRIGAYRRDRAAAECLRPGGC